MINAQDVIALEDKFYSQELFLSYSGLNKLMYSPRLYYNHYILQERDDKIESYLVEGKVIHCLLLDNDTFKDQFIITPSKLPTDNTRLTIDKVFQLYQNFAPILNESFGKSTVLPVNLEDLSTQVLDVLKEMNLHQSLKTDEQRIAKIITEETKSYFEFLITKGNKILLDQETYEKCKSSVEILRNNKNVNSLMSLEKSDFELYEVHNELYMETKEKYKNIETDILYPFGLKGIVDNLVIDHSKKIIYINDLKTSGKTVSEFKESIEYYNYGLQAAIYKRLVINDYKKYDDSWSIKFNFVVIDKYQQVCIFEVSNETMSKWDDDLNNALTAAHYHYISKDYSLPFKFVGGRHLL